MGRAGKVVATMSRAEYAEQSLAYRVRYLPGQLAAAERKVAALRNEARRLGLHDLVESHHG